MNKYPNYFLPNWKKINGVISLCTTRISGKSLFPFDSFNLATHVGDDLESVLENRKILNECLEKINSSKVKLTFLNQIHSNKIIEINSLNSNILHEADGFITYEKNIALTILVADCLPIIFAHNTMPIIANIHAGWKGLNEQIIENLHFKICNILGIKEIKNIQVWLGPCISLNHFEVDEKIKNYFKSYSNYFIQNGINKYNLNLSLIAYQKLIKLGFLKTNIFGNNNSDFYCTFKNKSFYSYRRDNKVTGRMAVSIYLS